MGKFAALKVAKGVIDVMEAEKPWVDPKEERKKKKEDEKVYGVWSGVKVKNRLDGEVSMKLWRNMQVGIGWLVSVNAHSTDMKQQRGSNIEATAVI